MSNNYKWDLFIDKLIKYKFNKIKAYREVYELDNYDSIKSSANRLFTNADFMTKLEERLLEIDIDSLVTKDYVLRQIKKEVDTGKKPSDRLAGLTLLSKYLALLTERQEVTSDITVQQIEQENTYLRQLYSNDN